MKIPLDELSHLLYLFVWGIPSYRCRSYLSVALETAQRIYTVFGRGIYGHARKRLKEMVLAGEIEMDEGMYGGHREDKGGWGAARKHIVFGLYQRNGQVMTVPVPDRKADTLIPRVFHSTKAKTLHYSVD